MGFFLLLGKGLRNLDSLVLAHNQLSRVPANVFSHLTLLNSLELEGNQITYVDKDAFAGLEGRFIDDIEQFGKYVAVSILNMSIFLVLQRICNIYVWAITISIRFPVNR